jgi:hypothetical protein
MRRLARADGPQGTPAEKIHRLRSASSPDSCGRVLKKRGDEVGARKAFQAAVENLSNTVDADHPKLLLARQLADAGAPSVQR